MVRNVKFKSRDMNVKTRGGQYGSFNYHGIRKLMRKSRRAAEKRQVLQFLKTENQDTIWNIKYDEVPFCDWLLYDD